MLPADDRGIVRRGLRGLLEAADIPVVGEAADGFAAARLGEEHHPDLMIRDIAMPTLSAIGVAARAQGRSNKEAGALLEVGLATAETHRANLMQKRDRHNTAEIVLDAVRKGLIV